MNPEYIRELLKLTRVNSKDVTEATIDHLCCGETQLEAAQAHGVQQEAVARLVKRLRSLDAIVTKAMEEKNKK